MGYSGAWGKLIHEKNMKSKKISCHCPCFKAKLTQAVINKHHVPFIHRKLIVFSHRCERKPFFIPLKTIFVLKSEDKVTKNCSIPFSLEENVKFCFFTCTRTINPEIIFQESEIVSRANIIWKIHQQTFSVKFTQPIFDNKKAFMDVYITFRNIETNNAAVFEE